MTLILSGDITLRRTWQPMDPDAAAYITAVESADGQALEEPVKIAIDNFVLGCKADGIWDAIKASCILAGARTLDGALVPLAGTAPTNFNFVSGDYNRKTGLVGDGSTKYLDSNRANNADPQDSNHNAVFSTSGAPAMGSLLNNLIFLNNQRSRVSSSQGLNLQEGFSGVNRSSSSSFLSRTARFSAEFFAVSAVPDSTNVAVYRRNNPSSPLSSNARIAFYSIGEALDLALLDARVTDLINKFAEVIP